MLYTPGNHFTWQVDSFGATWSDAAFGTSVTPGTNAMGSYTSAVLSNTAENAYGVIVAIGIAGSTGAAFGYLLDVGVDPANGTAYQVLIPTLGFSGTSMAGGGGYWYYFPVFVPKGSSVALRAQVNTGTAAIRAGVKLIGRPTRPDLVRVGSFVRAFNVNTGTSFGTTTVTAGANVWGSYTASLGTTAERLWFWQVGLGVNDATMSNDVGYLVEAAVGDASNKYPVLPTPVFMLVPLTTEKMFTGAPQMGNYFDAPSGSLVYARALHTGSADSNVYPYVYGVGG